MNVVGCPVCFAPYCLRGSGPQNEIEQRLASSVQDPRARTVLRSLHGGKLHWSPIGTLGVLPAVDRELPKTLKSTARATYQSQKQTTIRNYRKRREHVSTPRTT